LGVGSVVVAWPAVASLVEAVASWRRDCLLPSGGSSGAVVVRLGLLVAGPGGWGSGSGWPWTVEAWSGGGATRQRW